MDASQGATTMVRMISSRTMKITRRNLRDFFGLGLFVIAGVVGPVVCWLFCGRLESDENFFESVILSLFWLPVLISRCGNDE